MALYEAHCDHTGTSKRWVLLLVILAVNCLSRARADIPRNFRP